MSLTYAEAFRPGCAFISKFRAGTFLVLKFENIDGGRRYKITWLRNRCEITTDFVDIDDLSDAWNNPSFTFIRAP